MQHSQDYPLNCKMEIVLYIAPANMLCVPVCFDWLYIVCDIVEWNMKQNKNKKERERLIQ